MPPAADWKSIVAKYQGADVLRSIYQLVSTLALLVATLWVMHWAMGRHTWLIIALVLPAAGLFVRTFIIMHDCSHGSFLPWPKVNDAVGFVTGVLTLTPFYQWRRDHALHHASSGDLDRRGYGDIHTLTVSEYLALSWWGRLKYRVFRNPAFLLGVGPLQMIVLQRLPRRDEKAVKGKQIASVWSTNVAIAGLVTTFILLLGFKSVVFVWLPVFYIAAAAGILLFYLQHQFEVVLGAAQGLGLRPGSGDGQLLLPSPRGPAMVHRQHRPAPRAPSGAPHPELPPPAGARRERAVPRRAGDDHEGDLALLPADAVGRAAAAAGAVQGRARPVARTGALPLAAVQGSRS